MSGLFEEPDDAATPLADTERDGLIPSHIALRRELNAAEQANILAGQEWGLRQLRRDLLCEDFARSLHRHMFGDVWRWAGKFRTTTRNIGIDPWKIPVELRQLLDDARLWVAAQVFPPDEIAVRLHHRLVAIHPFPNGNGRHARLMADLLAMQLGQPRFPWGRGTLASAGDLRRRYIDALRQADAHDIGPLLAFARAPGDDQTGTKGHG
ncbi:Mobile mystery protein B (plasmid) [Rhodovastum atsumiense]|uniref:Mobile mystery protein B n=1 Tax=Rhodovastum atsumiense TaxID=504468 RepID=A0A5M6IJB9_9PROT|nr:mobile mystery protein B [Rhodovastum atsumiense]KAA5607929.1 mobile mystery protein B [Rhodovastum atsumiense]CAH2606387.1 Mobile mystery protein B [Rhodovastum atsumiense]